MAINSLTKQDIFKKYIKKCNKKRIKNFFAPKLTFLFHFPTLGASASDLRAFSLLWVVFCCLDDTLGAVVLKTAVTHAGQ